MSIRYTVPLLLSAILAGASFAGVSTAPAETAKHSINLARLSITKVTASSVNGDRRLDNVYYGVQNMFDDGKNMIGNINYSSWLGDYSGSGTWVKISFDVPVTVSKLVFQFENAARPPSGVKEQKEYALEITTQDGNTHYFESKSAGGFVTTDTLPEPLEHVSAIKILLSGFYRPAIEEIRVLGTPPPGVDTTPQTPAVVENPVQQRHGISITCDFKGETEAKMLAIAESAPPVKSKDGQTNWWYDEIDSFKLPYALNTEAIDYYTARIIAARGQRWNRTQQPASRLIYHASVKFVLDLKDRDLVMHGDAYVVDLFMDFSGYTDSQQYVSFNKSRRVTLDPQGKVLAITGDEKSPTSLNLRVGS